MSASDRRPTRRACFGLVGFALAAAPTALAAGSVQAATAKVAKADVGYQYAPHGDQRCGLCISFIADGNPGGPGSCKIVDGAIPPNGWCTLYAKRS
jgi:hypothetical protein